MINAYDYIIVGSGIGGLSTALMARELGSVLVITKGSINDCNTRYAQGGIAAAIGKGDDPQLHIDDTLRAGCDLSDEEAVRILASEAPARIADLVQFRVPFDTLDGEIALTMEAAHSVPRVLHAGGDATGEYIETTLSRQARAAGIMVLEDFLATEILIENGRTAGLRVLECRTGLYEEFICRYLILATGGGGQLFKYNTNPDVATGDGVSLAYEAGAEIMDMEFFQFHPTALRMPGVPPFLISEAVRGEGGVLRNAEGAPFMTDYHPSGDLAPRDVVARAIVNEMNRTGTDRVYLDVTHLPAHMVTTRFPHIYSFCLDRGLDITTRQIPVAPAAHYMIGGVRTNTWGETNVPGLFATGEVACTGVHGANRLASNSLLEAIVYSKRIIERTSASEGTVVPPAGTEDDLRLSLGARSGPELHPAPGPAALQQLNWDHVGIVRNAEGLDYAGGVLAAWQETLPAPTDQPSYEMKNLVLSGRLMAEAAAVRKESRGAHYRSDFTRTEPAWQRHIIWRRD